MTAPIVGAGLGGVRAAPALRHEGYDGELVLVGDEPSPPYERRELSKAVLSGANHAAFGHHAPSLAVCSVKF
jgi:NADPH-dependent 2,4-dienoyl-CoA reductase/sulfur reductase-like enzyme